MSVEPVNLNRVRKARARDKARQTADQNAMKFGRTKAEKASEAINEEKRQALLDQHRRDDP